MGDFSDLVGRVGEGRNLGSFRPIPTTAIYVVSLAANSSLQLTQRLSSRSWLGDEDSDEVSQLS